MVECIHARKVWNFSQPKSLMNLKYSRKISIFHGRPLSVLRSDVETDLPQDKEEIKWEGSTSDTECMRTAIHLIHQLEDFHNDL